MPTLEPAILPKLRAAGVAAGAACLLAIAAPPVADAQTVRQYQLAPAGSGSGFELELREVQRPTAGPNEVLVRVRAASLNRRDLLMMGGGYAPGGTDDAAGGIPLSDGAGEVIAVGEDVTRFAVGDRVAGIFFEDWIDGDRTAEALDSARGGNAGGMLSEVVVSSEQSLVEIPGHLSFEEAATLPCTGVTAWVSLFKYGGLEPEDYVLLQGTGGVSSYGLVLAAAAGAQPIITSSSDDKLERARELGAAGTANYRETPDWHETVRELTGGAGVDHVLDVVGGDALSKSLQTMGYESHVALIGGLEGFGDTLPKGLIMGRGLHVTGIYVGSRGDFEALNAFMSEHELRPVVDRVFDFEQAPAAFDFMDNGDYMGKIVIRL